MFTYLYDYLGPTFVHELLRPYTYTCLYAHIHIYISILPLLDTLYMFRVHVRPYTRYTCFYTPTPLYAQ